MPTVSFEGEEIECERGAVLRDVLLDAGLTPHRGVAKRLNCRGHGTCGTCAVRVTGDVSAPGSAEGFRLGFTPHGDDDEVRLSCRTRVLGDVTVERPGD